MACGVGWGRGEGGVESVERVESGAGVSVVVVVVVVEVRRLGSPDSSPCQPKRPGFRTAFRSRSLSRDDEQAVIRAQDISERTTIRFIRAMGGLKDFRGGDNMKLENFSRKRESAARFRCRPPPLFPLPIRL